eukprot:4834417-Pleurochrysis_carterae.AAC.1
MLGSEVSTCTYLSIRSSRGVFEVSRHARKGVERWRVVCSELLDELVAADDGHAERARSHAQRVLLLRAIGHDDSRRAL